MPRTVRLEQHRSLWGALGQEPDGKEAGAPHESVEDLIPALARLGYDGIEVPFKLALYLGTDRLKSLLRRHGMRLSVMVFTDDVVVPGFTDFLWTPRDAGRAEERWVIGGEEGDGETADAETLAKKGSGFTRPTSPEEMAEMMKKDIFKGVSGDDGLSEAQRKIIQTHLAVFQEQVSEAYRIFGNRKLEPDTGLLTLVVSHSLKDSFTHPMAAAFFEEALAWQRANGYTVAHETHRGRFLHSPWVARDFFLRYPQIREEIDLCADLSHWLCVTEAPSPEDPVLTAIIEEYVVPNAIHTHCRYGTGQASQHADPRSKDADGLVRGHERWWDLILKDQVRRAKDDGADSLPVVTMIGEHGPPPYQPVDPRTGKCLAPIWDVNHWIQLRRQRRFAELFPDEQTSGLVEA